MMPLNHVPSAHLCYPSPPEVSAVAGPLPPPRGRVLVGRGAAAVEWAQPEPGHLTRAAVGAAEVQLHHGQLPPDQDTSHILNCEK